MAVRDVGISASMLVLVLVATAIGAIVGVVIEDVVPGPRTLAIIAGLVATVIASVARYSLVFLGAGQGSDESRIPMVLIVSAVVASIAGSLAAHDVANAVNTPASSVFIGALAGLISAILMALLMINYHSGKSEIR